MELRRVVVTGVGMVTPLATGVKNTWDMLISGKSGVRKIDGFDISDLPSKIAAQVPRGEGPGEFNPDNYVSIKERRKMSDFILFGLAAVQEAVNDSGWKPTAEVDLERTGVLIGSGIG